MFTKQRAGIAMGVLAVLSLAGAAWGGIPSRKWPYPGSGSYPLTFSLCNQGFKSGYECVYGVGVCIPVDQQRCSQVCYKADGTLATPPGSQIGDVAQVLCVDAN